MNPLKSIASFLRYCYFRYSLVTELYMVEKWERNFIHCFMFAIFALLFLFNYKVLMPVTTSFFARESAQEHAIHQ